VGVYGFEVRDQVRVMFMELADGYDLRRLLRLKIVPRLRRNLGEVEWEKFRRVVIGEGPDQLQVKPFIALAIVRECLAGLRSLHERNIVHGDIKPENLILLRSGHPKIIDYGAAFRTETPPRTFIHTPAYAAVEVLESHERTPRSDLASLGYVLVELLTGKRLFAGLQTVGQCLQVKRDLPHRLWDLLPEGVRSDRWLIEFCQRLIDPRPERRFISAEDADLNSMHGAHAHFSQLYKDGLGVAHENEINRWVNSAMKRANE
jgi:serine/threonine-protein kinase